MKTVVTGGSGFIGSHLVKRLVRQGRQVAIASLNARDAGCQGIDLRDYEQARRALAGADTVFHLAARVGSLGYLHGTQAAELAALQANLVIDANVFRACRENGVKRLVYASSCAVYPMDRQSSPGAVFSETDLILPGATLNPDGGYGWAKLLGELQLGWMPGIAIGIARIFNVYGENEPLDERAHVTGDLVRKAVLYPRTQFRVRGDGEQSRDFLYIANCIEALVRLEALATSPPLTVNIGSGRATSIGEIAHTIARISGKGISPVFEPDQPAGPVSRTADIARARAILGWQPEISLETGLARTYAWVQRLENENIGGRCDQE